MQAWMDHGHKDHTCWPNCPEWSGELGIVECQWINSCPDAETFLNESGNISCTGICGRL